MSARNIYVAAFALATVVCFSTARADDQSADKSKELETVVVTASPISQDRSYLATLVGSVDRSQILQSGGANLADALANEPGVTGTGFASGASRPVIRGFDANRVRVLENGIGSFDVSDVGPDHGVPIDPLSTQRIELVRGAARSPLRQPGDRWRRERDQQPRSGIVAGETHRRRDHRRLRQQRRRPRCFACCSTRARAISRFTPTGSVAARTTTPFRTARSPTRTSTATATRSAARISSATTTSASGPCTTTRNTASRAISPTST